MVYDPSQTNIRSSNVHLANVTERSRFGRRCSLCLRAANCARDVA